MDTPEHIPSLSAAVRRWARSWETFFFRPADPTTLCLMRVIAGILVVYVHLAYTKDLNEFFGKDAWVNLELANDLRHGYPFLAPSAGWEDPQGKIRLPDDETVKNAFLDWLQTLPADPARRREALTYLYENVYDTAGPDREHSQHALAFAQHLLIQPRDPRTQGSNYDDYVPVKDEFRLQQLAWLENPPNTTDAQLIPPAFRKLPPDVRKAVQRNVKAFTDTLPREPARVSRIIGHLASQANFFLAKRTHSDPGTELERTLQYIDRDLPNDGTTRAQTLAYLRKWSMDERNAYTKGMAQWSIFFHVADPTSLAVIHVVFLAVMVMFAAGLFTRVTSVLTWLAALCYIQRGNQVLFGMDVMMNICLMYLVIGPSGATLSVDRWLAVRRARRQLEKVRAAGGDTRALEAFIAAPPPSAAANFATRLFQIHFCHIYFVSGIAKLKGGAWWNFTGIWTTIANPEFSPTVFAPYRWFLARLAEHRWAWELFVTFGAIYTLALEIGLPFLIWRPRLRPYMVMGGVFLHFGIATIMGLTVFSLFMMVLLMSFIPPEVTRKWLESGGRLLPARRAAAPPPVRQAVAS